MKVKNSKSNHKLKNIDLTFDEFEEKVWPELMKYQVQHYIDRIDYEHGEHIKKCLKCQKIILEFMKKVSYSWMTDPRIKHLQKQICGHVHPGIDSLGGFNDDFEKKKGESW